MSKKFMKSVPRMVALDVETTGLSEKKERIVQLYYVLYENGKKVKDDLLYFNPEKEIPKEVIKIHGITNERVKDEPLFKDVAKHLREVFTDNTVYVGQNVEFDLKFLKEEFIRSGIKSFNWKDFIKIDTMKLMRNLLPNFKLNTLHKAFFGEDIENAHQADSDVKATMSVLLAAIKAFGIDEDYKTVAEVCYPTADTETSQVVYHSDLLIWGDKGQIVLNFSKHRGTDLKKVDGGMLKWIMGRDFVPDEVKEFVKMAIDGKKLPTLS